MTPSDGPRILQICHGYDGPFLDCARQYASLFAGTGYRVTTVYLSGEADPAVAEASACDEVIFFGYSSKEMAGLKLDALRRIRALVAGGDFRLVIAHRYKPTWVACLATRLPVIGISHAFGVYQRFGRRLMAGLFRQRLLLLGVSDAVRDDMRRCLPGWPAARIQTLYNRIDIAAVQAGLLSRAEARAALDLPADAWVVGNVGRLHPDKDQATLLRGFAAALPQLPAGSLLAIMGSGKLEPSLKALAAELGIADQVRFLGQVAQGRRYFRAFDVFALSSDHEPFGMVLLEAMAAGVPLIGSDCGGGREVIGGDGRLFALGDHQALAKQLIAQAGAAVSNAVSPRLARCFSDEAVRERFWQLLEESKLWH